MRILAIDTALANCAAAVLDSGDVSPCYGACGEQIGRGHAERLMTMVGDVMAETSTAFTELDRIAVTVGPGSFTGLRVGLSVARGFGLVLGKPVVGVTTLAAIARAARVPDSDLPLLVALTGRGNEVYCQLFSADGSPAAEPGVQALDDLAKLLPSDLWLAGSAADAVAGALGVAPERTVSHAAFPDIRDVAELGLVAVPSRSQATPLYLRAADATPQTRGRIERQ